MYVVFYHKLSWFVFEVLEKDWWSSVGSMFASQTISKGYLKRYDLV